MKARDVIADMIRGVNPGHCDEQAGHIIAALESAGLCIVPMEATDGMYEAGDDTFCQGSGASTIYRAMIAAYRET